MAGYSFTRYLRAKKTVDDRALNPRVWKDLVDYLTASQNVRILEAGAGIGTMLERLIEHRLSMTGSYTALDSAPANIQAARTAFPGWAASHGLLVEELGSGELRLKGADLDLQVTFVVEDILNYLPGSQTRGWEVLIAHAFLDLIDLQTGLPYLLGSLVEGGVFYFSLNFDGLTVFEPAHDLDSQILFLYHHSMDHRLVCGQPSGSSQTGRQLFAALHAAGAEILSAGSSDWVVFARSDGYPQDEAYFLHFILDTIKKELRDHPELDPVGFAGWVKTRHAQVERGELVYLAHQLDFFGKLPD